MPADPGLADRRRQRAWYLSALAYRWSSTAASDTADDDLFAYLGGQMRGAAVIDCGCGPGLLAEKLVARGVGSVLAVDANPAMVRQATTRLAPQIANGTASVVQGFVDANLFARLPRRPDIIVFKRSLYAPREDAIRTVGGAVEALAPGGRVVVIHPERSLGRYVLGEPRRMRRHSLFHLFNRIISALAVGLGISSYTTYSGPELGELLSDAAGAHPVVHVPTSQQAYNLAAVVSSRGGLAQR